LEYSIIFFKDRYKKKHPIKECFNFFSYDNNKLIVSDKELSLLIREGLACFLMQAITTSFSSEFEELKYQKMS
jgi:hypothetical protein